MKILAAAILAALTASCVTPGDLAELQGANAMFQSQVRDILSDQEASADDRIGALEAAGAQLDQTVEDVKQRAAERVSSFETGNPLIDTGLQLLAPALLAGLGVNHVRDKRRKVRGEKV